MFAVVTVHVKTRVPAFYVIVRSLFSGMLTPLAMGKMWFVIHVYKPLIPKPFFKSFGVSGFQVTERTELRRWYKALSSLATRNRWSNKTCVHGRFTLLSAVLLHETWSIFFNCLKRQSSEIQILWLVQKKESFVLPATQLFRNCKPTLQTYQTNSTHINGSIHFA